jgi:uncharacterized membrane protein
MWKSISLFLAGVISGFLVYIKLKQPDVTNVSGDLIESQKVKDNSKHKLSRKEIRANRKAERKRKRLTKNK